MGELTATILNRSRSYSRPHVSSSHLDEAAKQACGWVLRLPLCPTHCEKSVPHHLYMGLVRFELSISSLHGLLERAHGPVDLVNVAVLHIQRQVHLHMQQRPSEVPAAMIV